MSMTINQKLDAVLEILRDAYNEEHKIHKTVQSDGTISQTFLIGGRKQFVNATQIMFHFYARYKIIDEDGELNHLLEYLLAHKMIETDGATWDKQYKISFEGRFFIQNGGYVGKQNEEENEKLFFKNIAIQNIKNAARLNYYTLALVIATIALFFATCVEKFHLLGSIQLWTSTVLFLFGVLFTAIVLKLVDKKE